MGRFRSFDDFYSFYLGEHSDARTRVCHYVGTVSGLAVLVAAAALGSPWLAAAAPVAGYSGPWFGHFYFEKNNPATFRHPLWSLMGDFRMLFEAATGRLDRSLFRAGAGSAPRSR